MDPDEIAYDFDAPNSDWNYEPSRAEVFERVPAALYTTDAEGWLTYYNDAAAELWGHRPVLGNARWCGAWRMYRADGTPLPHEDCAMAKALKEGSAVRGLQAILERPDGTRVPFTLYPTPLHDGTGELVAGSSIMLPLATTSA